MKALKELKMLLKTLELQCNVITKPDYIKWIRKCQVLVDEIEDELKDEKQRTNNIST